MKNIKKYIAESFINKRMHFVCACIISIDVVGIIIDYEIINDEIILIVDVNKKIIKIGLNTPGLEVEDL